MHSGCRNITLYEWICPRATCGSDLLGERTRLACCLLRPRGKLPGAHAFWKGRNGERAIAPAGAGGERPFAVDQANPFPQGERCAPPRESDLNLQ